MNGTGWFIHLLLIGLLNVAGQQVYGRLPLKPVSGMGAGLSMAPQTRSPLMQDQIRELIPLMPDVALAGEINERGINFPVAEETINYLKRLSAGPQTIAALYSFISNRPPSVAFSPDKPEVQPGYAVTLFAKAEDPDGDRVQYFWTSSAGNLDDKGTVARLDTSGIDTSNGPAVVTVSLTVIDRRGGSNSFSRSVTVQQKIIANARNAVTERRPAVQTPRLEQAWVEDKYTIIHFEGVRNAPAGSWGFIEITALSSNGQANIHGVSGMLPGRPCRVDLLPRENVAEMSFKEPPGTRNDWQKILIRARPKDSKRVFRLAVYWQALELTR